MLAGLGAPGCSAVGHRMDGRLGAAWQGPVLRGTAGLACSGGTIIPKRSESLLEMATGMRALSAE